MLPFYEYEYTLEIYNDLLKERNKQEQQNTKDAEDKYNVGSLQRQANKNLGQYKTPKMPSMKMPKF
tara:strand:- start:280 stop:477 length:198 start_codon:yes stop_codon:yes gene_type:complete